MSQQIDWNTQIKNRPGIIGSESINEIPTGTIDSTDGSDGNGTFTLAHTPATGSLQLYKNGILMQPISDYTLAVATVDYVLSKYPKTGDWHVATYRY